MLYVSAPEGDSAFLDQNEEPLTPNEQQVSTGQNVGKFDREVHQHH
jgi:hypothetical protein